MAQFIKKGKSNWIILFLSLFILFGWLLYFNSPLTAGFYKNPLAYVTSLVSLRYIVDIIILTELLFIYVLYRIGIPEKILLLIVGVNLASKLVILYQKVPPQIDYYLVIFPILGMVGIVIILRRLKTNRSHIIFMLAITLAVFLISPNLVENNRDTWVSYWHNSVIMVHELPPTEIFIVDKSPDFRVHEYLFYGNKFQHSVNNGSEEELLKLMTLEDETKPEYIVKKCKKKVDCGDELDNLAKEFEKFGYKTAVTDKNAILLKIET